MVIRVTDEGNKEYIIGGCLGCPFVVSVGHPEVEDNIYLCKLTGNEITACIDGIFWTSVAVEDTDYARIVHKGYPIPSAPIDNRCPLKEHHKSRIRLSDCIWTTT